jgi:hypothetical protein
MCSHTLQRSVPKLLHGQEEPVPCFVADEAVPLIKNLMYPYSRKKSGSFVN